MDLLWKSFGFDESEINRPAFEYRPQQCTAIKYSLSHGKFNLQNPNQSKIVGTADEWRAWLSTVPESDNSVAIILGRRHMPTIALPNHAGLSYLPFDINIFRIIIRKFHLHHGLHTIINRGWPTIFRLYSQVEKTRVYILRCENLFERDRALAITHFPDSKRTYALFLGLEDQDIRFIKGRVEFAQSAVLKPSTLISTFLTLEKMQRFKQVEDEVTNLSNMLQNTRYPAKDVQDLIGTYIRVARLKNSLESWQKEIEGLQPHLADFEELPTEDSKVDKSPQTNGDQPNGVPANNTTQPAAPDDSLDISEYLQRTTNEYQAKIRSCDVVLNATSLAFQMELSQIARQDAQTAISDGKQMKTLARVTMWFLPATFVASFMSMGLFQWHPDEDDTVLSPWWYIYFAVALPLTLFVLGLYYVFEWRSEWQRKRA